MVKVTKKLEREVLREDMSNNIKLILEQNTELLELPKKIDKMAEDIETLKTDVNAIKVGQKGLQEEVEKINKKLDMKVDRKEFEKLEHRVLRTA